MVASKHASHAAPHMKIMWNRGPIPASLTAVMRTIPAPTTEDPTWFHRCFALFLRRAGFTVRCEFPAPYRDRAGRCDIRADHPDLPGPIFLELDRTRPRAKSIEKLTNCVAAHGGVAAVICRTPP